MRPQTESSVDHHRRAARASAESGAVRFLPALRPTDVELLRIFGEAHVRLDASGPPHRRGPDTPVWHIALAIALAIAFMTSAGVAMAVNTPSDREAAPRCAPIHYLVDLARAPVGAVGVVAEAVERVTDTTGIPFVHEGAWTGPLPRELSAAGMSGAAPVVIAWTGADVLAEVTHRRDAFGATRTSRDGRTGALRTGTILLNADADLPADFTDRRSWGGVLMHELGHLVGLSHTADADQMMYPDLLAGRAATWGPTDRALLRQAGEHAGCATAEVRDEQPLLSRAAPER